MTLEEVWCGYELDTSDPDLWKLLGPNGREVAAFGAAATREGVLQAAQEHAAEVDRLAGYLERLLAGKRPASP